MNVKFVLGFTEHPEKLVGGFGKLYQILVALGTREIHIWPRFHAAVRKSLECREPDVFEVTQPLSPHMKTIQHAILTNLALCLKEIRKVARVDLSDISIEKALARNFDATLRRKLDPLWHKIGKKGRRLYNDVRVLRRLLVFLVERDSAFFLNLMDNVKAECVVNGVTPSDWLLTDETDALLKHAKQRVFSVVKDRQMLPKNIAVHLEPCAKRELLVKLVKEGVPDECTLVLIDNEYAAEYVMDHVAFRLNERGGVAGVDDRSEELSGYELRVPPMLLRSFVHYLSKRVDLGTERKAQRTEKFLLAEEYRRLAALHAKGTISIGMKGKNGDGDSDDDADPTIAFYDADADASIDDEDAPRPGRKARKGKKKGNAKAKESAKAQTTLRKEKTIPGTANAHMYAMRGKSARESVGSVRAVLRRLKPQRIIMFDPCLSAIREIEVYEAERPAGGVPTKVSVMLHEGSIEQQRFYFARAGETQAFQRLIKDKATIAVPVDHVDDAAPEKPKQRIVGYNISTGAALLAQAKRATAASRVVQRVVVDMREFRSALPFMLYRQGIRVSPRTLEVGDYILSPSLCVERKSVPDLIGSLNSGRLFKQAKAMCRTYQNPVVLIEFAKDRPFSLQGAAELTGDIAPKSVLSKLVLLTLHFPRMRLMWSKSPTTPCCCSKR